MQKKVVIYKNTYAYGGNCGLCYNEENNEELLSCTQKNNKS